MMLDHGSCGVVDALSNMASVIIKLCLVLPLKETLAKSKSWLKAGPIEVTMKRITIRSSEEITEKLMAAVESKRRKKRLILQIYGMFGWHRYACFQVFRTSDRQKTGTAFTKMRCRFSD